MSSYLCQLSVVVATVALALFCVAQTGKQPSARAQAGGFAAEFSGPVVVTAFSVSAAGDIRWD